MYAARYSDFNDGRYEAIGTAGTREEAVKICRRHAEITPFFVSILDEEFCDQGGYDMAAHIGTGHIRLYAVDPPKK